MIPKKIGIIGMDGKFGQWLKNFFEGKGCEVIGSDFGTETTNRQVVESSEVVIFAVTLSQMEAVIRDAVPFGRHDQLWIDIASLKEGPVRAMLESPCSVLGTHPLFAPDGSPTWKDKTVAICSERVRDEWMPWVQDLMQVLEARFELITPEEHDRMMLVQQNMFHVLAVVSALVAGRSGFTPGELDGYSTPLSKLGFQMMGRVLSRDASLYASIQVGNPGSVAMISRIIAALEKMRACVESGDPAPFERLFSEARDGLGEEFFRAAVE